MSPPTSSAPSEKSTVIRGKHRADYDPSEIKRILDASVLCHVGFIHRGEARIIPTAYVRIDEAIYLHGHRQNTMLNALLDGQSACINVTLLDGLVLARSAFHHSMNYRSVVIYGKGEAVDQQEKSRFLDALTDRLVPGRSQHLRPHTPQELNATLVVKFPIGEASAKIRGGPPVDSEKDYLLDTWAGVVNLKTVVTSIDPCPRLADGVSPPEHIKLFVEKHQAPSDC